VVNPVVRREIAGHLQKTYGISERRACSATGFQRLSQRYRKRSDPQIGLRLRLEELAAARVCYGYRQLHILLRQEGWPVNHRDLLAWDGLGEPSVRPRTCASWDTSLRKPHWYSR
jgi:putative transposase